MILSLEGILRIEEFVDHITLLSLRNACKRILQRALGNGGASWLLRCKEWLLRTSEFWGRLLLLLGSRAGVSLSELPL